jgi:hypothetical protein
MHHGYLLIFVGSEHLQELWCQSLIIFKAGIFYNDSYARHGSGLGVARACGMCGAAAQVSSSMRNRLWRTEEAIRGGVNGSLIKFFHKNLTYDPRSKPQAKPPEINDEKH